MYVGFLFSTSSPTLVISCRFDNSHSNRCEVISHCGFDFHFSDDVEHLFMYVFGHLYVFSGKMSLQILWPFFNLVVCFCCCWVISVLYIFWILSSYQIHDLQVSSHSVGCFSLCWWFPLLCQTFLIWCSPICLFLLLFPLPEETYPNRYCWDQYRRAYCLWDRKSVV